MTVGDEVVCIDGKFPSPIRKLFTVLPVEGNNYVIRAMYPGRRLAHPMKGQAAGCEVGLLLVGLINPPDPKKPGQELGFNADRFRLLQQRQTNARKPENETVELMVPNHKVINIPVTGLPE